MSEYAAGVPDELRRRRLFPTLPPEGMTAFCFYPMSKRRGQVEGSNWFSLPYDQRKDLMMAHGAVGRTFAGRVDRTKQEPRFLAIRKSRRRDSIVA